MTDSDDNRISEGPNPRICPNCGKSIPEGTAVVHGPASFCSLDCVASYSSADFNERARRLAAAARQ